MGDSLRARATKNIEPIISDKRRPDRRLVAATSNFSGNALKGFPLMNHILPGKVTAGDIGLCVLKVLALDIVRRVSSAKCPFIWQGLQALQLLCYPPLRWIERWAPLRGLVKYLKSLSRPMLVLSIATTLSDATLKFKQATDGSSNSFNRPVAASLPPPESVSSPSTSDTRIADEVEQSLDADNWMIQLRDELQSQGFILPERIRDQELRKFWIAANGDYSSLLLSVKKTIRWRETYAILSREELEAWSQYLFWHGHDTKLQPCLMIRLGLAFSNLKPKDKPRFAQAVVSQVDHGGLHLIDEGDHRIVVLMDCEGLSPFAFPMQMIRSVVVLLQDHYPNCLGSLLIIRLPPVARVIIQTLTQVLKPATRKKVRILGENYRKILLENLETVPPFLGGQCSCFQCSNVGEVKITNGDMIHSKRAIMRTASEDGISSPSMYDFEYGPQDECGKVLRTAVMSILMIWIFIAIVVIWIEQ